MYNLAHYDLDGDTHHNVQFLQPLLDPLLSPSQLARQVESFLLSPPPVPNEDFGLTSHRIASPVQESVVPWKVDIIESLIQDLGVLTSDRREWCINPLIEMVYYINCVGEVHFEVYGSHGIFQHGFMYLKNHHEGSALKNELKLYADLRDKNHDWVKNFVDKYRILMENYEGEWRKDTLSNSIMAPVVGSSSIRESYLPPEPEFGGSSQLSFGCTTGTFPMIETGGRGGLTRPKKTGLAAKRERIKNMRLEDLVHSFHLPIKRAAQELNLSVTTLRKVCRKYGIPCWPYIPQGSLSLSQPCGCH